VKYEAVLFDLDGVLLKSMEQHLEAWQHAFSRFRAKVNESDFYQLEGRGVRSVVEILTEKYGIDSKYRQALTDDKVAYYNSNFKEEFYDGIYHLLDTLRNNTIKMAVVTGGMRDRVHKIIEEYFKEYFSENSQFFTSPCALSHMLCAFLLRFLTFVRNDRAESFEMTERSRSKWHLLLLKIPHCLFSYNMIGYFLFDRVALRLSSRTAVRLERSY